MNNGKAKQPLIFNFSGLTSTRNLGLGIIGLALVLRLPGLIAPLFWSDEFLSLGIAGGSFFETIVSTFRYSAHPPAYYAQLNLWMLGGKNASFILLNSVLWSVAAIAAIIWLGRMIVGDKAACLSGLLLAVMPLSLYFAENARMYAMICFFQVMGWWSVERMVKNNNGHEAIFVPALIGLVLSQLLIGFAHGIGLVFSACLGLFGLIRLVQENMPRREVIRFLGIQCVVGVFLIPVLINGLMRETQHQPPENIAAVLEMLTYMLAGPDTGADGRAVIAGLIYFLCISAVFLEPRMRAATLVLVILPIGASFITTLTVKPILAVRPLALTLPLIALSCGAALPKAYFAVNRKFAKAAMIGLSLIVLAVLLVLSVSYITRYEKVQDFRAAAADLASEIKPADGVVFSESVTITWGLSWYLLGPEAVSSMKMQPQPNVRWQAMYNRLGNDLVSWLGLKYAADKVFWGGVPVITEPNPVNSDGNQKRIWFIHFDNGVLFDPPGFLQKNGYRQTLVKSHRGLIIRRFDASG